MLSPDTGLSVVSLLTPHMFYHFHSPFSFFLILSANKTSSLESISLASFFLFPFLFFRPFFFFFFYSSSFSFLAEIINFVDKISKALTGKFVFFLTKWKEKHQTKKWENTRQRNSKTSFDEFHNEHLLWQAVLISRRDKAMPCSHIANKWDFTSATHLKW